jgi:hypothetical protein
MRIASAPKDLARLTLLGESSIVICGRLLDVTYRLGHRIVGDRIHHSYLKRLTGCHFFSCYEHCKRAPLAHQPW